MANHKILVIDDSRVIRARVRDMLPAGNFEVLEAKDGEEGLNMIRQEHPNLIMLDFLLPKVSGFEVFQQIQGNGDLQKIPLVVMSGREEEVLEKIPKPFDYFEFIKKPFEQKELIGAIKSAMKKATKPRPAVTVAPPEPEPSPAPVGRVGGEVEELNKKIATLQADMEVLKKQLAQIEPLKKQLNQIVTFIKQKLK